MKRIRRMRRKKRMRRMRRKKRMRRRMRRRKKKRISSTLLGPLFKIFNLLCHAIARKMMLF